MTRLVALLVAVVFAVGSAGLSPAVAQTKPGAPAKTEATPPAKAETKAEDKKKDRLNINSASAEQLKALPGIGDALAKKIIENRPYNRKGELLKKNIIPQGTYDKIEDQITAKQK